MEKSEMQGNAAVKRYAFFGITSATVATLTAIVAVPMLCLYLQGVQSSLQDEVCSFSEAYCYIIDSECRTE